MKLALRLGAAALAMAAAVTLGDENVTLKVGDKAPGFKTKGTDGKEYTLKQFVGKRAVVVAWFPKAFTGG